MLRPMSYDYFHVYFAMGDGAIINKDGKTLTKNEKDVRRKEGRANQKRAMLSSLTSSAEDRGQPCQLVLLSPLFTP